MEQTPKSLARQFATNRILFMRLQQLQRVLILTEWLVWELLQPGSFILHRPGALHICGIQGVELQSMRESPKVS